MTTAVATAAQVRPITLDAAGITLSALLGTPVGPPRGTILALHGAGMSAGYFHGPADPSMSLLRLGVALGMTVLALDRPGYRLSAGQLPDGQYLADQAATVAAAVRDFARRYPVGPGVVVLAHSFGGKLALTMAADGSLPDLLGLDISGCGHRYAVPEGDLPRSGTGRTRVATWGPLRLYPPTTFRSSRGAVAPIPPREVHEAGRWPETFDEIAPAVRLPVRFTFAEYEPWWRHDLETLTDLRSRLSAAPRVSTERQLHAGHNISLGWTARSYHLRVIGFAEELIAAKGV
ncbi:alpha/beta fold hydrolase [Micromonospora sp. KC606]|uniref:alpha/beta hydrolase n=1 Tax=Micromonospora sp. KC606 TaxID=2530379 RepID=UPI001051725A|nr:alpha/beta fold hydrolase [Micromonospora sp. KC606]TDC85994.1 alpha/beta fold hydrolase [Micromonospora sp. KC606]